MRDRILCLSFTLLIFVFGMFINFLYESKNANNKLISITVKGAVVNQGVYFCKYGISVSEVLEICGGMTPITNDTTINIQKRYSTIRKNYEEN